MDVFLGGDESCDSKVSDSVPPNCDEFSNESTKLSSSVQIDETQSEPPKKVSKQEVIKPIVKSSSSRVITTDTTHMHIEPSHIIEYEWPVKSGERFFIQEQIAELLDVKSFKRKYPDLCRHMIEMNEREHLLCSYKLASVINEHQMHGLTALRAIEVHELMAADYPAIYSEYQRAAADKVKLQMAEQQKQLDAIKVDKIKLQELRRNAIRSAADYNAEVNAVKRVDRRHFWDIQTSIIQSPRNRWRRYIPEATRPGPYPVALISGQYQHYYKRYSAEELRGLPLTTVLDYEYLLPPKRGISPPPVIVQDTDLATTQQNDGVGSDQQDKNGATATNSNGNASQQHSTGRVQETSNNSAMNGQRLVSLDNVKSEIRDEKPQITDIVNQVAAAAARESAMRRKADEMMCSICGISNEQQILACSNCPTKVHPQCASLPERVVTIALGYKWNCIECKKCTVCEKPDNEDAMMFCDRCDRGYHTFCVGLSSPPTGTWVCTNFCSSKLVDEPIESDAVNDSSMTENGNDRDNAHVTSDKDNNANDVAESSADNVNSTVSNDNERKGNDDVTNETGEESSKCEDGTVKKSTFPAVADSDDGVKSTDNGNIKNGADSASTLDHSGRKVSTCDMKPPLVNS